VTSVVDASKAAEHHLGDSQAIMNGIAALPRSGGDADGAEFLLTGKGWRWIRHVRLMSRRGEPRLDRLFGGQSR
jgi:hypothetical protein